MQHSAVAIVPCNDLDETQGFYERLGFVLTAGYAFHKYRILHDNRGASIHLKRAEPGWVVPERNAHGIYLYSEDVAALAAEFRQSPQTMPWDLVEFAVSDPNGTLVRIGWPAPR